MIVGIINATYGVGSTGYLAKEMHDHFLRNGIECYAFWATKCSKTVDKKKVFRIGNILDHKLHALLTRITDKQGFFSLIPTIFLCLKIKRLNIDIVQLHNLHSNYINIPYFLKFCAKQKITVNPILHDCWFFTGKCFHFYAHNKCDGWLKGCKKCPIANFKNYSCISKQLKYKEELFANIENLYVTSGTDWIYGLGKKSILKSTKNHFLINDWVDLNIFNNKRSKKEICDKFNLDFNKKIALFVSQIWNNKKGVDALIEIGNKYGDKYNIVAIGNPNGYQNSKGVKFIGYTSNRQELIDFYYASDIVVNVSRFETFGLVTVESMACGTPVLAYSNTGTKELVNNNNGWLVEDGNIEELLVMFEKAIKSNKSDYSEFCKKWVFENFNSTKQLNKYIDLYKQINDNI